jgi:hypothetical protein
MSNIISPPPPENRADYEIMSKNLVETERPQLTIQYGVYDIQCWISNAKRAHAQAHAYAPGHPHVYTRAYTHRHVSNTYCLSTARMIRERASVLRYTYIVCLVHYKLTASLKQLLRRRCTLFMLDRAPTCLTSLLTTKCTSRRVDFRTCKIIALKSARL